MRLVGIPALLYLLIDFCWIAHGAVPVNKAAHQQQILRAKRLLQLRERGLNYHKFLEQEERYGANIADNSTESLNEQRKRVLEYQTENPPHRPITVAFLRSQFPLPQETSILESLQERQAQLHWLQLECLTMPNVQNYNTKRFETMWMSFLSSELNLSERTAVVAFSSNADAVLRYAESYPVQHAALIDACSLYTLGERHGRDYRYPWINEHLESALVLATTSATQADAVTISFQLNAARDSQSTSSEDTIASLVSYLSNISRAK